MKHIKTMFAILLIVIQAKGDTETVDGVTYNYHVFYGKDHGEAVISRKSHGYGSIYRAEYSAAQGGGDHLKIPTTLGGYPVTSIDDYAFFRCGRTSVTIPNSITNIGMHAFEDCRDLRSVMISPSKRLKVGAEAFACDNLIAVGTTGLAAWCNIDFFGVAANPLSKAKNFYAPDLVENLVVPDGVEEVKPYAFLDCKDLATVTIPNSVKSIGDHAFSSCGKLTSVVIPNSVTNIGKHAFYRSGLTSVTIPNSVTSIGYGAFEGCRSLPNVTIPNSVTTIGDRAFYDCCHLQSVYIADLAAWCRMKSHGKSFPERINLFLNGESVKDLIIPDSVANIRPCAFSPFSYLTSVTIPNSVTNIGDYAFDGNSHLKSVHIADLAAWCRLGAGDCFSLDYYDDGYNLYLKGELVTDLIIPDSVAIISDHAFTHCRSLTSVTIPNSVTNIGAFAFANCRGLKWCVIPSSVKSMESYVFSNSSSLSAVYYLGNAPAFTSDHIYDGSPSNLVSYVMEGSTGWLLPDFPAVPKTWPLNGGSHSRAIKHGTPMQIKDASNGKGMEPLVPR